MLLAFSATINAYTSGSINLYKLLAYGSNVGSGGYSVAQVALQPPAGFGVQGVDGSVCYLSVQASAGNALKQLYLGDENVTTTGVNQGVMIASAASAVLVAPMNAIQLAGVYISANSTTVNFSGIAISV